MADTATTKISKKMSKEQRELHELGLDDISDELFHRLVLCRDEAKIDQDWKIEYKIC
jgi:hypothetical protein